MYSVDDHHIIKSSEFKDIEALFSSLGDIPPHGPLLLLWAAVNQLAPSCSPRSQAMVRKCGNQALELKVFPYINACLKMEPFCGTTVSNLVRFQNSVEALVTQSLSVCFHLY